MRSLSSLLAKHNPKILNDENLPIAIKFYNNITDHNTKIKVRKYLYKLITIPENFCEGFLAFEEYKKVNNIKIQDHMYNAEFLTLKFNCSLDYCIDYVNRLKKDKTTNLEGFIKRHGEVVGRELYNKFLETSMWKDDYIEKHGIESYRVNRTLNNKRSLFYYTSRGHTEEESKRLLKEYQINNSGLFKEFYQKKQLSDDEIIDLLNEIELRKANKTRESVIRQQTENLELFKYNRGKSFNKEYYITKYEDGEKRFVERLRKAVSNGLEFYINKYGETFGKLLYEKRTLQYRITIKSLRLLFDEKIVNEYYNAVNRLTEKSLKKYGYLIPGLENYNSVELNIDHIYSKKQGFLDKVDPKIISHITNLRLIPKSENLRKGIACHKTLTELFDDYTEFERKMNEDRFS